MDLDADDLELATARRMFAPWPDDRALRAYRLWRAFRPAVLTGKVGWDDEPVEVPVKPSAARMSRGAYHRGPVKKG